MKDLRLDRLAELMLDYSLQIKKGDCFAVSADITSLPLIKAVLNKAADIGALASVKLTDQEINRLLMNLYDPDDGGLTEGFLKAKADLNIREFENLKAELIVRAYQNDQEMAAISPEILQLNAKKAKPFRDLVINHRKWVLFEYPTPGQAQRAGMSYDEYFDFVMDVSTVDYEKMRQDVQPLVELMQKSGNIHIKGPGTDLRFSIGDIPVIPCCGECNIPDGECFTAPVKESVEGEITFNTPSIYWGTRFENIHFVFSKGRIIEADAGENTEKLNKILDSDAGARYVGEFSLGFNPLIRNPFCNTLFDEKICGSFHFTPGSCYDEAPNGNDSSVHWDLVQIQRPEYGGGEIYMDNVLIRKDGLFVPDNLQALNHLDADGGQK